MREPRESVVRLAAAHVRASLQQADAERVAVRLHECLARLVGPGGVDVLLARALSLAKLVHPGLAAVEVADHGLLQGLNELSSDPVALEQAATAVIAQLIELLVVLVGEELTMRILSEVLDEAPVREEGSS